MNSSDDDSDTTTRVEDLIGLLELALRDADALNLAIVGIRISEALDALHASRNH